MKMMKAGYDVEDTNIIAYFYNDTRRTHILDLDWCFMLIDDLFNGEIFVATSNRVDDLFDIVEGEWNINMTKV